ncbi:MAG: undecaprenyldiphospho-muramoylpentapeptide beta-N-acetylglucosaminyltransferase [Acidobacteria bacterium]|nr:undecaprenyldiphospho-muramoylpentapeptide beta-N-acetylglucosaminyltransferase [Acidobacteriota bacterium]
MARTEVLRVMVAGGGTGGHLFPGIAVAKELLRRMPDAQIVFVGTARGLEADVIPRERFPLDLIRSAGLKGKSLGQFAAGLALLPLSAWDAWRTISRRRPHVVVGLGGYSSGPLVMLAALRRVPTLLLEQNAVPGFTNRVLGRIVKAAAVNYEASLPYFGAKGFVAGNPIRAGFVAADDESEGEWAPRTLRVLVFGGSQGAHAINLAMVEAAPKLAASTVDLFVTHQTGIRDLELVRRAFAEAGLRGRVEGFLYEMDREMKTADLVVCRAGATTLAEIAAAGRPAILVPFPMATDDHQRKNAEALASVGAAVMIEQKELSGTRLAGEIVALARDAGRRHRMADAVRKFSRPNAAALIVERLLTLAH